MIASAIRLWLTNWISDRRDIPVRDIDARNKFSDYGIDSSQVIALITELSRVAGRSLSPTLLFRYPTIAQLAAAVAGDEPVPDAPSRANVVAQDDPIAIVGLSCRFPGATGPEAFWQSLCHGLDAVREIPSDRWSADALYDTNPAAPGKSVARVGGFLDDIDRFDPLFFGISPREAQEMDPQQRMMLELTWEALEDAGVPGTSLRGSRTGVFIGVIWQDYSLHRAADLTAITQHSATGRANNIIANRVSYALGLRGPSMVIDTACSASLVAVHLACQSLWSGESTMAVAGGVNLMLVPDTMVALSKFGGLSPDGHSRAFDARANGFARGEGCGAVVLKPLSRALADGDRVYCVVRGTAVNNNGESSGLTAPSPLAQEAVLRDAWARAGREPHRAHYVEAHGTGTALGDPIEASALGAVFGADRPLDRSLRIGSVKTNIGHLEGAAGIAGLIKVALAIAHRAMPPSLHFQTPNPDIAFDDLRLQVQTTLEPWPYDDELALAGVSSFGWGGTNAHVVLEEARRHPAHLLPLSGESTDALRTRATALADALSAHTPAVGLSEICHAAVNQLDDGSHRAAVVARSSVGFIARLRAIASDLAPSGIVDGPLESRRRVAFVCTPQGSAWWGMGRELLDEPVFRAEIETLDRALRTLSPLSILDELAAPQERSRLSDVTVVQPLLFAVQAALVALLRSWGIEPDIIIGHSLGELVAAYVSGALGLDDAVTLIHHHSCLYGRTTGMAGMAAIGLPEAALLDLLTGYDGRITIAAYNSRAATVVSGEPAALDALLVEATARGITCHRIDVNIGGHCHVLDPVLEEYRHALRDMTPRRATIPMMSTVTVSRVDGRELDADYWVRNMREPVRFSQAMDVLLAEGYDTFIEISPTPVLTHPIQQSLSIRGHQALALGTMRRGDERSALLDAVGSLYVHGVAIHWGRLTGRAPVDAHSAHASQLLPLSARSSEALRNLARAMSDFPAAHPDVALADLCYASGVRRSHGEHRLAIVADSMPAMVGHLRAFLGGESAPGQSTGHARSGRRRIVFVLAGQGSQWAGMGRELLAEEPVFRQTLERCDAAMTPHTGWSLLDELARDPAQSRLNRTEIAQPLLFAIEIALAALWSAWGIAPDAVIGHSVGEVAAAHLAGALSFDDAVRIVCRRGQVMSGAFGQGRMAAVHLSAEEVVPLLRAYEGRIDLAAINGPHSIVLSGEPAALDAAIQDMNARGISSRLLDVAYAFHSRQMDRCAADLVEGLQDLSPTPATCPIFSTTSSDAAGIVSFDADHWGRNLRAPVHFAAAVDQALEQGYDVFLEIGPHPVLARSLAECLEHRGSEAVSFPSLRRGANERQAMLESLGALYALGCDVDFRRTCSAPGRHVPLPTYPWHHSRFPLEPRRLHSDDRAIPTLSETNESRRDGDARERPTSPDELFYTTSWERAELPPSPATGMPGHWLIFADSGGVGQALAGQLEAAGEQCHMVCDAAPETVIAVACDVDHQQFKGVVYLYGLDDPAPDDVTLQTLGQSQQRGACGAVALIQALARRGWTEPPGVWLVTRNCYPANDTGIATSPSQSPLWGLGQVVGYEHPELRCRLLDLSQLTPAGEAQAIARELLAGDREDAVAWRADVRHVARLVPYRLDTVAAAAAVRMPEADEAFRLESAAPGDLQRLALRTTPRTSPGPGEIEIAVHAAGVNFIDVLIALNDYPDDLPEGSRQLGRECAGVVVAIGEGVTNFSPGQPVVALAPWSFGSRVTTLACLAVPRPPALTADDAATVPMAFLTACYALEQVGRLAKGERILVHAATGGVGLAAIQVAQRIGAEIFATAGSPEKRELLRSLGIEHVMDSRTLAFADDVMTRTGGQGVDLVLNCLVGDAIPAGLSILRAGGRFCDISKRDIRRDAPLALGLFRKGISYSAINLGTLITEQPDAMGALLRDVIARVDTGVLQPLRHETFPISRATDAFQQMARAGHIGKLVLRLQDRDARIETPVPLVSPDATYLITGGLGALGLATAAWLAERGARHLMLVGRHRPSPAAERALADLRRAGADVVALQADVTARAQMVRVIDAIDARWPLRGVVHTAGTLDDGVLMQLTPERIVLPMAPKVDGAWNLHELTADRPLDFFVLFSSAVSLIGAPGQANYAAANAFLDALARYRRSRGLPALSVQWGSWSDVGMAARHADRGERLAAQGMRGLIARDALHALGALLAAGPTCPPHVGVLRFDATRWCEAHALSSPRFTHLRDRTHVNVASTTNAIRTRLTAETDGGVRREILELYLREQAARVLRLEPVQIEIRGALQRLGLDSLMTLELRRRIETGLGLRLPVTVMWDYPTIAALTPFLLDRLGLSLEPSAVEPAPSAPSAPDAEQLVSLLEALGQISSDDLARLAHDGARESKRA